MEWPAGQGTSPESRLWVAIVAQALTEYEEKLIHMKKLWDSTREPVAKFLLSDLQKLRYEIRHPWFARICELVGRDQDDVIRRIKQLDKQYGLSEIEFTEELNRLTTYQIRLARKHAQNE